MSRDSCRGLLVVALGLAALAGQGCGKRALQQPAEKAEAVVDQVLDAWTRGEPADKFAGPQQPIQAKDPDWKAGYRLLSFLTAEAKQIPEQPNHVRCRVALSLQDRAGKKVDKEVVYDVQLGDTIVIGRVGG
jgi:hypothetical protein